MKRYTPTLGYMTIALVGAVMLYTNFSVAQSYSELWGEKGELWTAESRLPDYSFAGYERGEKAIPDLPVTHNIRDFGALGDGEHDDTKAFQRAVAEIQSGVIAIPPGRYLLSDIIEIDKSNIVLRGAGSDETILYFQKTLTDVRPNWGETTSGRRTSNYSWSGGFIRAAGKNPGKDIAVPDAGKRGDTLLSVPDTKAFASGQEIILILTDDSTHTLTDYIYAGDAGDISKIGCGVIFRQVFRILEITGRHIRVDRPLRTDLRPEWKPILRQFTPSITHVGIENIGFEFPDTPYKGHFTELGHNGITMWRVANCWIRNIHFQNAESGIFFDGQFCQIEGISYHSTRQGDRFGNKGHHGVTITGGDNLFTNFDFQTRFLHDLTVTAGSIGNVFSNGHGIDLNFDHHRRGPYENLFTNIDVGKGSRIWSCGGGKSLGKHCAARSTFWNLRSTTPLKSPGDYFSPPMINIVGITTKQASEISGENPWFEAIPPKVLSPQNIHEAQLQKRLQ